MSLHGVKTIRKIIGGQVITIVKSGVINLVGIAPTGRTNELVLIVDDTGAAEFGKGLDNFTIPQALEAILKQGAGPIIVNNVYDPATNDLAVADEPQVITGRKIKTDFHPTTPVVITNVAGTTTYVEGTHYTIDAYGNIKIISNTLANGVTLHCNYSYFDPTTITAAQINGTVVGDVRTGIKLFDEAKTQFGFSGRILIAPGFSSLTAVALAMEAYADLPYKRCITVIDAPSGTSKATAIAGRQAGGSINFYTRSKRVYLVFPELKDFTTDPAQVTNGVQDAQNSPGSAYVAGVISRTDKDFGYWYSPSNKLITGVTGTSLPITDEINDENSDANLLNEAGIATFSTSDGPKVWGNRNASYPDNTAVDSFLCVVRAADLIEMAIEQASKKYVDLPINQALIDDIRQDVNVFINSEVGTGALIDGNCFFDKAKNPDVNLAAGKTKFGYKFLIPTPNETIEYESFIDISLFSKLG